MLNVGIGKNATDTSKLEKTLAGVSLNFSMKNTVEAILMGNLIFDFSMSQKYLLVLLDSPYIMYMTSY